MVSSVRDFCRGLNPSSLREGQCSLNWMCPKETEFDELVDLLTPRDCLCVYTRVNRPIRTNTT